MKGCSIVLWYQFINILSKCLPAPNPITCAFIHASTHQHPQNRAMGQGPSGAAGAPGDGKKKDDKVGTVATPASRRFTTIKCRVDVRAAANTPTNRSLSHISRRTRTPAPPHQAHLAQHASLLPRAPHSLLPITNKQTHRRRRADRSCTSNRLPPRHSLFTNDTRHNNTRHTTEKEEVGAAAGAAHRQGPTKEGRRTAGRVQGTCRG
jgi:hypothetical protein